MAQQLLLFMNVQVPSELKDCMTGINSEPNNSIYPVAFVLH